jgi:multiple sugar transport system substrate-binding protein
VLAALTALGLVATLALAGCDEEPTKRPQRPPRSTAQHTTLTFGVWGPEEEILAYREMVDDYNAGTEVTDVEIRSWRDSRTMMAAFQAGEPVPDLFMITRSQLADIHDEGRNKPLLELLDERGVEYGDGYYRDAIEAFSGDDELQCMPYGVSPMVIYYNPELIDFARMRNRGLPAPDEGEENDGWNLEEFRAAAEFASRPRKHTRGLYVEPTLRGLSPFIYAAGGHIYNDDAEPTSLALSDGGTRDALTTALEVLRDPQVTLTDRQLRQRPALDWFKRGRLGMLPGFRDLTPDLRGTPGLDFDVMPMPRISGKATVGDFTGLCISAKSPAISQAADFLVHAISDDALSRVAQAGYLAPANLDVATSPAFLQPDLRPAHAGVFNASVNDMVLQPLIDDYPALERVIAGSLEEMLHAPVLDIDALTTQADDESRRVLDPDYEPSDPPSGSESPSEPEASEPEASEADSESESDSE